MPESTNVKTHNVVNSIKRELQPHAESVIALAENAFQSGRLDVARKVVEHYLRRSPQKDQFYCNANVLLGLILDNEAKGCNGAESIQKRKYALSQMIIAIDVATSPENASRYDFIIYNTSISCWSILRPLMRAGRAKSFTSEVCRLSAALEKCEDPDMEWRIMYLSASAVCCLDSQQIKPAEEAIDKAIQHADRMLNNSIALEQSILNDITVASSELEEASSLLRKSEEREELLRKKRKKVDCDATDEIVQEVTIAAPPMSEAERKAEAIEKELTYATIAAALARKTESADKLKMLSDSKFKQQATLTRLYMQRVHTNPTDSKKILTLPSVAQSLRVRSLVQLQCIISGCVDSKDQPAVFTALLKDLNAGITAGATDQALNNDSQIAETLIDICRVAWQVGNSEYALQCFEMAGKLNCPSTPVLRVKMDLCKAQQMVVESSAINANSLYTQRLTGREAEGHMVSQRIEAMKQLERILPISLTRIGDFVLVQEICITIWNTLLPLLQPHLRKYTYRALQLISKALEEKDAPLTLLRARIHFELCKCENETDFVGKAKEEADKAISMDYGTLIEETAVAPATRLQSAGKSKGKDKDKGVVVVEAAVVSGNTDLDRARSMDHIIKPLASSLGLRLNVYDAPSNTEDQVILLLQQATESTFASVHTDSLLRASTAMEGVLARTYRDPDAKTLPLSPVSLQDIHDFLNTKRILDNTTVGADGSVLKYTVFSILDQKRTSIMVDIARMAQQEKQRAVPGNHGNPGPSSLITIKAVQYVLSLTWNPTDTFCRELIDKQIEMHFHLAGSLVDRLSTYKMNNEMEEEYERECDKALTPLVGVNIGDGSGDREGPINVPDPRALGLISKYATEDMNTTKRLILLTLLKALQLSMIVNDEVGVQNAIVHFWNLHLHIFRKKLSSIAMPEVFDFLKISSESLHALSVPEKAAGGKDEKVKAPPKGKSPVPDATPVPVEGAMDRQPIDEKLTLSIVETLVEFLEGRGDYQEAYTSAMATINLDTSNNKNNNCGPIISPFARRRLCESATRCAGRLSVKPGTVPAVGVAVAVNALKFDSVFLTIYSALSLAEMPSELTSNDTVLAAVEKANKLMDVEVAALLLTLDWSIMSQDDYDQVMEMQAEILTRIIRLYIVLGDIRNAQLIAEKCLSIVAASMERAHTKSESESNAISLPQPPSSSPLGTQSDQKLSPRVWRWISVCEKYFGMAICRVIKDEGQDESLKSELRLAGIRHFALACTYGIRAQRMELVIDAATVAWNVISVALNNKASEGPSSLGEKNSILNLQFQILQSLLECKQESATIVNSLPILSVLLQQMYVSMVTQLCDSLEWNRAFKLIMEAFQHVPTQLQKPLWRLRVIIMSKQGKNVLDGIQKMLSGDGKRDVTLQARVYAILARASSTGRQQLDAYRKTIELMGGNAGRVDYILETVQWMSSYGLPRTTLSDMLFSAMDTLYELEESNLITDEGMRDDASGTTTGTKAGMSAQSARSTTSSRGAQSQSRKGLTSTKSPKGSRTGGQSGRSHHSIPEEEVLKMTFGLDAKQCEQAVRTTLMLAMLQSDEAGRLERLLESLYFIKRSMELWSESLTATDKAVQWAALSSQEKSDNISFDNFNPPSSGQSAMQFKIPSDAMCLLSWSPPPLFLETNALCTVQSPLRVPSTTSYPLLPLTVHYLLWASNEFHTLGHHKHSLLILAWLRAILIIIPSQKKEFILAAAHYSALTILHSCGVRSTDIEKILSPTLGTSSISPPVFLSSLGEEMMSLLSRVSSVPQDESGSGAGGGSGSDGIGEHSNVFKVSTLTKVMGTTDTTATDTPSCILSICRSLQQLGQVPLAQSLISAAKAHAILRGDKYSELIAISMHAEYDLLQGKAREALALLLLSKDTIGTKSDGILTSKMSTTAAICYARLGEKEESLRVLHEIIALLDTTLSVGWPNTGSTVLNTQNGNGNGNGNRNGKDNGNGSYLNSNSSIVSKGSSIASITSSPLKIQSITQSTVINRFEGNIECVSALVEVFYTYISLNIEECSACVVSGNLNFDFKSRFIAINSVLEGVLEKVTVIAGRTSVLTAKVLERASYACYTCLLEMQNVSSSIDGMTVNEYSIWFEETLRSIIQSTSTAINIRRDLCSRITEEELIFEFPFSIPKMGSGDSPKAKGVKTPAKPLGRKASKLTVTDTDINKTASEDGSGSDGQKGAKGFLLSCLQQDLSKTECLLARQKYHLGVYRGHNASAAGGLTVQQQRKKLAELAPPERYLEQSKPGEEVKTADFEVRPIGEGILLSSSALQTITGLNTAINTATNTNTATAPSSTSSSSASSASPSSSTSTTAVDSAVLYSAGYVLQLSGTGAYDSMWIPVGEEEDDPSFSGERTDPPSTVVVQGQSGSTRGSMDSRDVTIDKIRNKGMVVSTDNNEEYVPIDSIAVDARNKLSVQTVRAIASRRFEVASIGAGALIASHGCRESRTAVCWLLQLQSISARALLFKQWQAALNPTCESSRSLNRLRALESCGNDREDTATAAELAFLSSSSVCWNRLDVSADPSQIMNLSPPNSYILCLQMCPHQKVLYACVGVRSSTTSGITSPTHGSKPGNVVDQSTTDNKNLKYTAAGEWAMSKMAVSEQQRRLMLTLTAQHVVWCEDVSKFIGKYGDCLTNTGDIEGNESIHSDIKVKKTEAALEERLRALLHDMNSLIDEILGPKSECGQFLSKKFKDCISAPPSPSVSMRGSRKSEYDISATNSPSRRPSTPPISGSLSRSTSSNNMKKTDKNIRKNDKKRGSGILSDGLGLSSASPSVLLLIDPSFSSLPWEGLPLIEKYFEGKSCRDFSIHMHGHRLTSLQGQLNSPGPGLSVGSAGVKVLADPFGDDKGCTAIGFERDSISSIISQAASSKEGDTEGAIGKKWTYMSGGASVLTGLGSSVKLSGEDWVASCRPIVKAAAKGSDVSGLPGAVFVHTIGRFSALLSPRDAVTLNLTNIALLFIADLSLNDSSSRRQNSSDNVKRSDEIAMEQPWAVAGVLSLSGVGSLVIHRWSTSLASQRKFVLNFWENYANRKKDVCTSLTIANSNPSTAVTATATGDSSPGPGSTSPSRDDFEDKTQPPSPAYVAPKRTKRWVRLARCNIGLPAVTYID